MNDAMLDALMAAARDASVQAYCPYSHFAVGAAVQTVDGRVFAACNVENASYGLSICAERNAVFHAVAAGAHGIVAVAIYTPTREFTTPCGACRQVLREFAADADVFCGCDGATRGQFTVSQLLPHAFSLSK